MSEYVGFPPSVASQCDDGLWVVWCGECDRQLGEARDSRPSAELLASTHNAYHDEDRYGVITAEQAVAAVKSVRSKHGRK